jgi:adenine-specific DNA-methyltransferase
MLANATRKVILVQFPEAISNKKSTGKRALELGLAKVSDITIDRNRRVIAAFEKEAKALLPTDAQRQFADSLGFKVYKLAKSFFSRVEFAPDPDKSEAENIELLKQYIRDKEATFHVTWERDTVLDEVLLKNGFMLDYTLTRHPEFAKNEVFLAADAFKQSLICLDQDIDPATVEHFKTHNEDFFICLELSLDTTKKWNLRHSLGDKFKAF